MTPDREGFLQKWTTGVNERDDDVRARVAADLDALLAAERERCCKAVCPYCNDPAWTDRTFNHAHISPVTRTSFACKAAAIRDGGKERR